MNSLKTRLSIRGKKTQIKRVEQGRRCLAVKKLRVRKKVGVLSMSWRLLRVLFAVLDQVSLPLPF